MAGKRLRHQKAARRDLLEIWRYTDRTWNAQQADTYLIEIDDALQDLTAGRARGTAYGPQYMRLRIKAHIAFYRETAREIVVVRVLHKSMDFDRHLPA